MEKRMVNGMKRLFRNLSSRLILAFILVIIVTTLAAGIPTYLFIRGELDQQVRARVDDGSRVTQTLLQSEESRLINLAALTAERPTLKSILEMGDLADLEEYLNTFRASVDLDFLIVRDPDRKILVENPFLSPWSDPPFPENIAYYASTGNQPSIALLASHSLFSEETREALGYVTLGILLDDEFMAQLAAITGFEQSVVMGSSRIATSLVREEGEVGIEEVIPSDHAEDAKTISTTIAGQPFYTSLVPILDSNKQTIAQIEIALPIDNLITAERRALTTLTLSTALVIIVGSVLGGLISRRLTHPLSQLTQAAAQGDIDSPYPSPNEPAEIATLAIALEGSRKNIKRIMEDLEQAKAWSETLIQSIIEGIVTFDDQGRITSFNQGAELITGWSQDEVLERSLDEIFHLPEGEGTFSDQIPPSGGRRQIPIIARHGKQLTLAVTGAELFPPKSKTAQSALVLRDITEEEAAQNLRSYFLANISHEFRTPLSAINASVELLLEELEDLSTAEIGELLNSIHMSVAGLQTLIDNLLESLSIEAGRFQIRRRPTDLNIVIQEAIHMMKPLLDRRQQKLSVRNPLRLTRVMIDPTRLTQVITNLLSNASKYSPVGKEIDLMVEKIRDDLLKISVADRGRGIPPIERSDIFRRFVRLDSQDGTQYGIGLGLSVVKAIVKEHGGEVGVEDRPVGGSIFWFTLPISGVQE
jgi:two-component system phosphate regulon sensor histidine kinase PhoR